MTIESVFLSASQGSHPAPRGSEQEKSGLDDLAAEDPAIDLLIPLPSQLNTRGSRVNGEDQGSASKAQTPVVRSEPLDPDTVAR